MKIDVRKVIKGYDGKDLKNQTDDGKEEPLTIRLGLNKCINGTEIIETPRGPIAKILTEEEKGRIYQLSGKIWGARKEVDFTLSECEFIKKRAGIVANVTPIVYGRVVDLLEGKNEKEERSDNGDEKDNPKKS